MNSKPFAWFLILTARCGGSPTDEVDSVADGRPGDPESPSAASEAGPDAGFTEQRPSAAAGTAPIGAVPAAANGDPATDGGPEPDAPRQTDSGPLVESDAGASSIEPTFETIDRVDTSEGDPILPPGSSAFIWSRGIGNWFVTSSDGDVRDAASAEIVPPREESQKAYRVTSAEPPEAVDLWAQLDHPAGRALDLGEYGGIAFWARMNGPSKEVLVAFSLDGRYFDPGIEPGTLNTHSLAVSSEWEYFVLEFEPLGVDNTAISSFDFIVGTDGESFDVWIDDLALLCADTCP